MKLYILMAAALWALAACATVPVSAPGAPTGPSTIPSGSIDFGDFRRGSADSVARRFAQQISSRYGEGMALNAVSADLSRNQFSCRRAGGGRGDPPDRICARSLRVEGCAHTWQVLLYNDGGGATLSRIRSTYDRACGDDDLLGG